jgi:hypothetical protein
VIAVAAPCAFWLIVIAVIGWAIYRLALMM